MVLEPRWSSWMFTLFFAFAFSLAFFAFLLFRLRLFQWVAQEYLGRIEFYKTSGLHSKQRCHVFSFQVTSAFSCRPRVTWFAMRSTRQVFLLNLSPQRTRSTGIATNGARTLLGVPGLTRNKKLVETSASLLVTSALLLGTRS